MIIIVDTNIVFSAILNVNSRIGRILLGSKNHCQFYTCEFLRVEIINHKKKIISLTALTEIEVEELIQLVTRKITFINEGLIPPKTNLFAEKILEEIDPADAPFVALTKHLKGKLWTGDKKLITGLKNKNFPNTIDTTELMEYLNNIGA
ncbi:MAG: PIN domain-containing protein [Bacteroidia bacterium]|nr:PIN domain-containing protein [Bacteroidia bacterium]